MKEDISFRNVYRHKISVIPRYAKIPPLIYMTGSKLIIYFTEEILLNVCSITHITKQLISTISNSLNVFQGYHFSPRHKLICSILTVVLDISH